MKSLFWLAVGVAIGFVVARKLGDTSGGRRFFSDIDRKTKDFGAAVTDGYRNREAELRAAIDGAEDTISGLSNH